MSMFIDPTTPYGKELWKWDHHQGEAHPQDSSIKGMRPPHHQDYPAMMYKALQKNPWKFEQEIAKDEPVQRNLESRGFVAGGKQAAANAFDAAQQNLAVMAAARNYEDRRMSEPAQAERDTAEQASSTHLGEIPRKPVRKYVRKAKTTKH